MSHRPRLMAALLVLALALAGCTGETPPPPSANSSAVNAPALPPDQLPPLTGRGTGATITPHDLVSDGSTMVMVAGVDGRRSLPLLRWSADAGATWTDGQLTDDAARATEVDEVTSGIGAVARLGDERLWLAIGERADRLNEASLDPAHAVSRPMGTCVRRPWRPLIHRVDGSAQSTASRVTRGVIKQVTS